MFFDISKHVHVTFVLFWCKNIGAKDALGMLVKLTPGIKLRVYDVNIELNFKICGLVELGSI
jgi:hypothetical protein